MKIPSAKAHHDMELAAELRAAGATWETVGEKLKRHPNVVVRWTSQYRPEWERLSREAETRVARQGTCESRSAMRVLLRHKSSKVRVRAVDQLTKLLRAERAGGKPADGPEDLSAFLAHVEEMSDDELEETLAEFAEQYRGKNTSSSGPDASPGQADGAGVASAASAAQPG